jgi:16S rRNA (cytosine1402-N4)-methyltransferase
MSEHISVMPGEILSWIAPRPGGRYLDGTLGLGGHTLNLCRATRGEGFVLGIDRDAQALEKARDRLASYAGHVFFVHSSFQFFEEAMDEIGWEMLDGALLDLGVSSLQLDQAERGFSFLHDGPLDMRMDRDSGHPSARTVVNTYSFDALRKIIREFGEEPMAGRVAKAIVRYREEKPIKGTLELADIVAKAYPAKRRALSRNHPATKTFQALRIAVNHELDELQNFLDRIVGRLAPGARLAVLSFHSLEDRIVKWFFRREAKGCICPREYPVCQCGHEQRLRILTKKPVLPSEEEMAQNSRSRSAKLRVAERL